MSPVDVAALAAAALLALAGFAVATALTRRAPASTLVYAASAGLCLVLLLAGAITLATGDGGARVLPLGVPWLGAHLRLDALSGFFLVVLGTGGAAASVYAIGYGRHEAEPDRVLPFYPAFLAAMALALLAADAFSFLVAWEAMSVLSWALVLAHHRPAATRTAGFVYIAMASFGAFALLLAFGLLAGPGGDYAFAAMRGVERGPALAAAILALALIGAGSKAGLAPLHVWLPLAHPAAPSHVSALMSGVMTKVAVYGFVRLALDLAGPLAWWTSPAVILIGAGTAVLGILWANVETDVKRALACSTIENIGVIFAGLGLALAFRANGMTTLAALALSAALFHAFNHMAFKSLLFMVAGATLTATGRRRLDGLGGLIRRMPVTSALALVGVVAIAALPPLNGFASEWLLFQAVLASRELPQALLQIVAPAAGGLLALAAALAAAAFVRLYGVAFLGRPRSAEAAEAVEVDRAMLAAMGLLAALCVLAGILPGLAVDALSPAVRLVAGGGLPRQAAEPWLTLTPVAATGSSYNGLLVLVFAIVVASGAAWAVHRFASRATRRGPAWDCGFPGVGPVSQYGAGSFAQPIRRVFGPVLLRAREEVDMPAPGELRPARHRAATEDLVWDGYLRLAAAVEALATRANRLQYLSIRRYLSLVFAFLILLLTGLAAWS